MFFPSAYFRAKARAALKGRWQTALLIALVVSLPSLLAQAITTFTGNDPLTRIQNVYLAASRDGVFTPMLLQQEIESYIHGSGFLLAVILSVAAFVITPCLTLGMYRWMLGRLRGSDEPVSTVFCRVRLFLKALGLHLLIILRVFLWMLPGLLAFSASLIPVMQAGSDAARLTAAIRVSNYLTFPLLLATLVPGIMAALRYAMAEFIMADEPETGILDAIRRSKQHMREMKRMLFSLMLSFFLWYMLIMVVASMLASGTGTLSLVVQMLGSLALTVYVAASEAAFFLETMPGKIPKRDPAAGAPMDNDPPEEPESLN